MSEIYKFNPIPVVDALRNDCPGYDELSGAKECYNLAVQTLERALVNTHNVKHRVIWTKGEDINIVFQAANDMCNRNPNLNAEYVWDTIDGDKTLIIRIRDKEMKYSGEFSGTVRITRIL